MGVSSAGDFFELGLGQDAAHSVDANAEPLGDAAHADDAGLISRSDRGSPLRIDARTTDRLPLFVPFSRARAMPARNARDNH